MRLTSEQVKTLARRVDEEGVDTVDLTSGSDGRLVVRAVKVTERLVPLRMTVKAQNGGEGARTEPQVA